MISFRELQKRTERLGVSVGLLLVAAVPSLVPIVTSAAQVTERSIELSSSSRAATAVSYTVNFTAINDADAFVVEFCSNTPLIGQTCAAPGGMVATAADSNSSGVTDVTGSANKVIVTRAITAAEDVSVVLTGINNPTASGTIYARIVSYDTAAHAADYTANNLGTGAQDTGSVALSITDTVGVSGAVLETMTFCVAGGTAQIDENCTGIDPEDDAPVLRLGQQVGGVIALQPGVISTGTIYTQISTNAANGAIVSLKSSATNCGGLLRAGDPTACDITPALTTGIGANEAKFGVRVIAGSDTAGSSGVLQPVAGSSYNDTTYVLNAVQNNTTGVTSTYGDKLLDTNNKPANNKNYLLTFGAQVNNDTPAGLYSTDLSLIATGKF